MLPAVFRTKCAAPEYDDHRIVFLQFGQLAMFPSVIRKVVIGKDSSGNNVGTHFIKTALQSQLAQPRMFIRTAPERPMILAIRLLDWQVINGCKATSH
jgi:hypothetical protein